MANNLLRVRATISGWSGGPGLSTFYFDPGALTIDAAMVTGVTGRVRAFLDAWKSFTTTGFTLQADSVADVLDFTTGALLGQVSAGAAPAVVVGTGGVGTGPAFVCVVGRMTTNSFINGKRLRGRVYVGPLHPNYTDSVAPEGGLLAAVQNGLIALTTTGGGPGSVVWHRPTRVGGGAPSGGAIAGITNTSASPVFGVLKSRR